MIIFNILGAVMVIVGVGIAFGVRFITGTSADGPGDGPEMILMGSLSIFFDVTYRTRQSDGHWISPFGGGNLFFIPVWGIGAVWLVVGIVYCFTQPIPGGPLGLTLIGLLIALALGLAALQIALSERPNFSKFIGEMNSDTSDERSPPRSNRTMKRIPCPACDLPCDDVADGKCPWCGVKLRTNE